MLFPPQQSGSKHLDQEVLSSSLNLLMLTKTSESRLMQQPLLDHSRLENGSILLHSPTHKDTATRQRTLVDKQRSWQNLRKGKSKLSRQSNAIKILLTPRFTRCLCVLTFRKNQGKREILITKAREQIQSRFFPLRMYLVRAISYS